MNHQSCRYPPRVIYTRRGGSDAREPEERQMHHDRGNTPTFPYAPQQSAESKVRKIACAPRQPMPLFS